MKEIGGYIELDASKGEEYHTQAVALNCGRNCLRYLIRTKDIKKVYLPKFLCASVAQVCEKEGISYEYYPIDSCFRPIFDRTLLIGEWLYLVNYYGLLSDTEIKAYKQTYPQMVLDNAQAFFDMPVRQVATLYTCRKYFGVPDGAYLYTDDTSLELETDYSYDRMRFLLGRFEKDANSFYEEYVSNNEKFAEEPLKGMSKLTHNLMRALDYGKIATRRTENFIYLHENLKKINKLELRIPKGAFMYPLYTEEGGEIRKELCEKKIYIPMLWPDVLAVSAVGDREYKFAENILPLPVDQRYGVEDMENVIREVRRCIG